MHTEYEIRNSNFSGFRQNDAKESCRFSSDFYRKMILYSLSAVLNEQIMLEGKSYVFSLRTLKWRHFRFWFSMDDIMVEVVATEFHWIKNNRWKTEAEKVRKHHGCLQKLVIYLTLVKRISEKATSDVFGVHRLDNGQINSNVTQEVIRWIVSWHLNL